MDPSRVSTIEEWQIPSSFREIRVILRFANFYLRFIRDFSWIV